ALLLNGHVAGLRKASRVHVLLVEHLNVIDLPPELVHAGENELVDGLHLSARSLLVFRLCRLGLCCRLALAVGLRTLGGFRRRLARRGCHRSRLLFRRLRGFWGSLGLLRWLDELSLLALFVHVRKVIGILVSLDAEHRLQLVPPVVGVGSAELLWVVYDGSVLLLPLELCFERKAGRDPGSGTCQDGGRDCLVSSPVERLKDGDSVLRQRRSHTPHDCRVAGILELLHADLPGTLTRHREELRLSLRQLFVELRRVALNRQGIQFHFDVSHYFGAHIHSPSDLIPLVVAVLFTALVTLISLCGSP